MTEKLPVRARRYLRRALSDRPRLGPDGLRQERDQLRRERDLLRLVVQDDRQRLESVVAELHRLREAGFGRPDGPEPGYRYLFVLTYGRTGSTLLQGILTRTPGYCIRGENGQLPYRLFQYHKTALHHRDRVARREPLPPQHPWWGMDGYPEDVALREFRHLVLDTVIRPTVGARVVGYKEIDWGFDDLSEYVAFLRLVFPGARFVVNTRNVADVAVSKWWANRPNALERVEALDAQVRKAAEELGTDAYHVHYDHYVADPTTLRGLFEWLGEPFDRRRVEAVMAQRHSY